MRLLPHAQDERAKSCEALMLSWFVGNVDVSAAAVLVALGGGITIIATAFIAKYQSADAAEHAFKLEKMKIEAETQKSMYQVETDRVYKTKQLEQNLITSHRETC
jgi:hypothetical protein